jgi:thiol:disulfide interchange protein DsbC
MLHQKAPSASENCNNPVKQNIDLATRLNVTGTPTMFLENGQRISGGRSAQELEVILNTVK